MRRRIRIPKPTFMPLSAAKELLRNFYKKRKMLVSRITQIDTGHHVVYFKTSGPYGMPYVLHNRETIETLLTHKRKVVIV